MDADAISNLKKSLQGCFGDKTVLIVGSGLSCAEGIPGMLELSEFLCNKIPDLLSEPDDLNVWLKISAKLGEGKDLESVLLSSQISPVIENNIIQLTSELILEHELQVLQNCIQNQRKLKIEKLLPYLSVETPKIINIITTNYDRLIEFAGENLGFGVDTMMTGKFLGKHNPNGSLFSLCTGIVKRSRTVKLSYKDRIHLYKPHGSLDWYSTSNGILYSSLNFNCPRMIITPGTKKYLKGYESPFDVHRDQGNQKIDQANAIIFVGYGFNDTHLQTHISNKLRNGTKGIILTRNLSENATSIIKNSPNLIALSDSNREGKSGTLVTTQQSSNFISETQWWDLERFVEGVLSA